MKKIFSLFAAVLFAGSMMAEEATMAAGNTASDAKVNEGAAIKVGSSKAAGDMTITVGEGATSLTFYAAGWKPTKNESQTTTTIALSAEEGITLSDNSFDLNNNDALTGSAVNFTIENEDDYEFTIDLTGAANGAVITIAAERRFVIWGATYEVGAAPAVFAPAFDSAGEEFLDEIEVAISCKTEGAEIYYTLDGTYPEKETALLYTDPIKLTESTSVYAIAIKGEDKSKAVLKSYTKVEPMTVPEAIAALKVDDSKTLEGQYVKGIVCKVDSMSEKYSSIYYWISEDGTETNAMEVYSGKGIDGADIVTVNAVQVGDKVVVYGNLKVFKPKQGDPIYEFDKSSKIVKLEPADPTAISNTTVESKAVKVYENGQLIIIKNGVRYDALGQMIR